MPTFSLRFAEEFSSLECFHGKNWKIPKVEFYLDNTNSRLGDLGGLLLHHVLVVEDYDYLHIIDAI